MQFTKIATWLTGSALTFALSFGAAFGQVTEVAKNIPLTEKEYWEDRTFGHDDFWESYTGWRERQFYATSYGDDRAYDGLAPYYRSWYGGFPRGYEPGPYDEAARFYGGGYGVDAGRAYRSPRMDGYTNPRMSGYRIPPQANRRDVGAGAAYADRDYQTRLWESDYLAPDSFEPMDEDVRRWPRTMPDYHDKYIGDSYEYPGYFYPAVGLGTAGLPDYPDWR